MTSEPSRIQVFLGGSVGPAMEWSILAAEILSVSASTATKGYISMRLAKEYSRAAGGGCIQMARL